jgi:hypothetical protein
MKTFEGTVYDPICDCGDAVIRIGRSEYLSLAGMFGKAFGGFWMDAEGKRVRVTIELLEEEADAKQD